MLAVIMSLPISKYLWNKIFLNLESWKMCCRYHNLPQSDQCAEKYVMSSDFDTYSRSQQITHPSGILIYHHKVTNDELFVAQSFIFFFCQNCHLQSLMISITHMSCGWGKKNYGSLVTWFCYQLIAKPANKTDTVSWPHPYASPGLHLSCNMLVEFQMWWKFSSI